MIAALALAASLMPAANGSASTPQRWAPAPIASDQYESSPAFAPDGTLYFMRSTPQFAQWRILQTRCENGAWTPPLPPRFAATAPALDADPFVSADGRRLYFVSTRQNRDGGDQLDIWRVTRRDDGDWGDPQRLPEPVNSTASELMPREDAAGRLYFGSDRPGGFGQGDIYIATPLADGAWRVDNAGPPVSTAAYEYEADVTRDGNGLVVVANRGTRSHLYHFRRGAAGWVERGAVPASEAVFQVGPRQSPDGKRVLFAQADGARSGELFVADLDSGADTRWPPHCGND